MASVHYAVIIIVVDKWLEARESEFRTPILAVAVGIYLPFHLSVPIFIGGLIAYLTSGKIRHDEKKMNQSGLLLASGLITGEALLGILLAVPMMLNEFYGWSIPTELAVFEDPGPWIGVIFIALTSYWLYAAARAYQNKDQS